MVEQKFIQAIDDLNQGQLIDFEPLELERIIKEYPCFQSIFLMQAIALKQNNEEGFQEQLPSLASRVLNRAVLYDKINFNYTQEKAVTTPESPLIEEKIEVETVTLEVEETTELPVIEKEVEPEVISKNEIIGQSNIDNEQFNLDEEMAIIDDEVNSILEQSEALTEDIPLQKELEKKPKKTKKFVAEVKEKPKKQAIVTKVEKKTEVKEIISVPLNKPTVVKKTENMSFTTWLKNKKPIDQLKVVEEKIIEKNKENEFPIDMAASHEAALFIEAKKSSFKLEDFLVDQIEKKQERKEKNVKDFTHAVSETYAKILVNQGKIQEAINVYKELSIKYPKKSSNFAFQIDNLKNSL